MATKRLDDILRAAFDAGHDRGVYDADSAQGHDLDTEPDFDEWREKILPLPLEDD